MAEYPLVNSHKYDFSSIELKAGGTIFTDIQEISYKDNLAPGELRGANAGLLGRTRGEYTAEASMTLSKNGFQDLVDQLGDGYKEKSFDVTVVYAEEGSPLLTDIIVGCRITEDDNSHSRSPDALTVSLSLHVMYILKNGKAPFKGLLK